MLEVELISALGQPISLMHRMNRVIHKRAPGPEMDELKRTLPAWFLRVEEESVIRTNEHHGEFSVEDRMEGMVDS